MQNKIKLSNQHQRHNCTMAPIHRPVPDARCHCLWCREKFSCSRTVMRHVVIVPAFSAATRHERQSLVSPSPPCHEDCCLYLLRAQEHHHHHRHERQALFSPSTPSQPSPPIPPPVMWSVVFIWLLRALERKDPPFTMTWRLQPLLKTAQGD